jgi:integrase/recombinase XerC
MGTITDDDRELIRLHLDWFRRTGVSDETVKPRRNLLFRLAKALPNGLRAATEQDLDEWQSWIMRTPKSNGDPRDIGTIAGYTSHCRRFYQWALLNDHVDRDPALRLPVPRVPHGKPRPIPTEDLQTALACAPEPIRTWLLLASCMGLRCMEIAAIKGPDIPAIAGRLFLDGMGKGKKAFRLPIPPDVVEALRPHMRAKGPLFRTPTGRPTNPHDVSKTTSDWFKSIGMPYAMHELRHWFGTYFYQSTKDVLMLREVMRHESLRTSQIYAQTTTEAATAAMDRLGGRLKPKPRRRRPPSGSPGQAEAA